LLTKTAAVRADRDAKCPLFKKFLKRITSDVATTSSIGVIILFLSFAFFATFAAMIYPIISAATPNAN
jgi:hypothetical protein